VIARVTVSDSGDTMDRRELNLLLIDDDEVDIITVKRAFSNAQISTNLFVARDGTEALAILRGTEMPATRRIVMLDLEMPRVSGIELLRTIRDDPALRSLPVVVMTTSSDERDRKAAFDLHVAGYIVKPLTFQAFTDAMVMLNKYWQLMEI